MTKTFAISHTKVVVKVFKVIGTEDFLRDHLPS